MTALGMTIDFTTFQHVIINLQLTILVTIFGLSMPVLKTTRVDQWSNLAVLPIFPLLMQSVTRLCKSSHL